MKIALIALDCLQYALGLACVALGVEFIHAGHWAAGSAILASGVWGLAKTLIREARS